MTLDQAFDWFAGYLLLDALVGNTDRHQDNWATIRSPRGQRLAASFDHASCLGSQLSDQEREERLDGRRARTVERYAAGATTKFEGSPSPLTALLDALDIVGGAARHHWRQVPLSAPSLAPILAAVPAGRMSEPARRFADALYRNNLASVSQALSTMGR